MDQLHVMNTILLFIFVLHFLQCFALRRLSSFKMSREVIATNLAPRAIGPYSQGIKSGGVLYVSGCLGLNPDTMKLVDGGVGNQARQVLTNLKNIIEAGGGKMSNTAKVVILLTDMAFFAEVS